MIKKLYSQKKNNKEIIELKDYIIKRLYDKMTIW